MAGYNLKSYFENSYALIIEIKRATVLGGGLPHESYVETFINGQLFDTTIPRFPAEWNKILRKSFPTNFDSAPMVLLFAVYKKRWTSTGFKLVGTLECSLDDLKAEIRTGCNLDANNDFIGSITKDFPLRASSKNFTLTGSLLLRLEIQHGDAKERSGTDQPNSPLIGVNPMRSPSVDTENDREIEIKPPNFNDAEGEVNVRSAFANPKKGTMAGLLTAAKNVDAIENKLLSIASKNSELFAPLEKTKVRWYELDHEFLKSCHGQEKDYDFKKYIPISSMMRIRPYTTDENILDLRMFAFEIEAQGRTYAFGCETEQQKTYWLTALQTSLGDYLKSKRNSIDGRSFSSQNDGGTIVDVLAGALGFGMTSDQLTVAAGNLEDSKAYLSYSGIDMMDIRQISKYLVNESIAAGSSTKLLKVLQLLLLVQSDSEGMWDTVAAGIQRLLTIQAGISDNNVTDANSQHSASTGVAAFEDNPKLVELLRKKKAISGGTAYTEVSKLAALAVREEQEIEHLRHRLSLLEGTLERLEDERLKQSHR